MKKYIILGLIVGGLLFGTGGAVLAQSTTTNNAQLLQQIIEYLNTHPDFLALLRQLFARSQNVNSPAPTPSSPLPLVPNLATSGVNQKPSVPLGETPVVPQASIKLLTPNGGEMLKVGDQLLIKWTSSNLPSNSKINIGLVQRTDWQTGPLGFSGYGYYGQASIADNTSDTGSFVWTIPSSLPESDRYMVQLGAPVPWAEKGPTDLSDAPFTITGGHPVVVTIDPKTVPIGGRIHITVDPKNSGVADRVKSIIVSLTSLDGTSWIPNNGYRYNVDSEGRWYDDFTIPISAKLGTWVIRGIGLNDDNGIIQNFWYPLQLNEKFTVTQ